MGRDGTASGGESGLLAKLTEDRSADVTSGFLHRILSDFAPQQSRLIESDCSAVQDLLQILLISPQFPALVEEIQTQMEVLVRGVGANQSNPIATTATSVAAFAVHSSIRTTEPVPNRTTQPTPARATATATAIGVTQPPQPAGSVAKSAASSGKGGEGPAERDREKQQPQPPKSKARKKGGGRQRQKKDPYAIGSRVQCAYDETQVGQSCIRCTRSALLCSHFLACAATVATSHHITPR